MANKIVKYTLTNQGTIPTWIEDGGYYPTADEVMIGATVDGSDDTGLGELETEADVKTYLDTYTCNWTEDDYEWYTTENGRISYRLKQYSQTDNYFERRARNKHWEQRRMNE